MKRILIFLSLACTTALAQTKSVNKTISNNALTESLVVPSGKTLTIASGATIAAAAGSTITGFTASAAWADITGKPTTLSGYGITDAAPLASPTFTGTVTIPSGASISGYLTTASASSTYAPLASPTFTGTITSNGTGGAITTINATGISVLVAGSNAGNQLNFPARNGSLRTYHLPDINSANVTLLDTATAASTYLTPAAAGAAYQPLSATLTSFAALANAAGVLTNNGSGTHSWIATTNGGNGTADSGKVPLLTADGGLVLGKNDVTDGNILTLRVDIGNAINAVVGTLGQGVYAELNGSTSQAFHAHITGLSTGSHTGFDADLTGGTGSNFALGVLTTSDDYILYHRDYNAGDIMDRYTINASGTHTWYANGTTLTTGSNKTSLTVATPSGTNTITIPARTGTLITSGDTGTVTNTILAGSIAISKLAITGTADGTKFLRDDGSWQAISTGITIGTTTITGGTSGRLLTSGTTVGELTLGTGVSNALGNTVNAANGLLTYGIIGTSGAAVPLLNVTNTWSTQRFGTSTVYIEPTGTALNFWDNAFGMKLYVRTADPVVASSSAINFGALGFLMWQSTNRADSGTTDTYLGRNAAAQIQLGLDASTPVAQRIKAGDGSGTNIDGSSLTLSGGQSTGTGDDGDVILQTTMTGTTGTSANSYQTRQHTPAKFTNLTEGAATNVVSISLPSGRVTGGTATFTVWASDGTDHQALTSEIRFSAVNKAGTITATTSQTDGATAASAGTLTVTYDATASGNNLLLRANATSSLTQTILRARLVITALNGDDVQTVTPQ
jgi:hypothetical protein